MRTDGEPWDQLSASDDPKGAIGEENEHGKGVAKNKLANGGENLEHAAEEDRDTAAEISVKCLGREGMKGAGGLNLHQSTT